MATYRAYARVSTEEQSDASIEIQKEFLFDQQQENFPNHKFIFYHEKQSGMSIEKRPQLLKLLSELEPDDIVGFYDNSRLGRDTLNNHLVLLETENKKARIHIGGKLLDATNPEDQLSFSINSAISKYYRQSQHNKSILGIEKKKKNGDWIFTSRLYGYQVVMKNGIPQVSIIEEEAKIIRFIFEKYADGWSILKITNALNDAGHVTRELKPFHNATVRRYILKPIYMGKYPVDGAGADEGVEKIMNLTTELVTSNYYEPIVTEELWYQAFSSYKRLTRKHSRQFQYRWSAYELTSIMKCYYCNTSYVHSYHKSTSNKVNSNYVARTHQKGCQQKRHTFRGFVYEELFRQLFKLAFVFKEKIYSYEQENTKALQQTKNEIQVKLDGINDEINHSQKIINNLVQAIKSGIELAEIKLEIEAATKRKDELLHLKDNLLIQLNDVMDDIDNQISSFAESRVIDFFMGSVQERRVLHTGYIKHCYIKSDRMYVWFIHDIFIEIILEKNHGYTIQEVFPISIFSIMPDTDYVNLASSPRTHEIEMPQSQSLKLNIIAKATIDTTTSEIELLTMQNEDIFPSEVIAVFENSSETNSVEADGILYSRKDLLFCNDKINQMNTELKNINELIQHTLST